MIKGKIEMIFDDDGAHINTDVELTNGLASKCFVIDSICDALQLKGEEKTNALMIVALHDKMKED
jgi:hypothetical protein